jgi:hypothetical protein
MELKKNGIIFLCIIDMLALSVLALMIFLILHSNESTALSEDIEVKASGISNEVLGVAEEISRTQDLEVCCAVNCLIIPSDISESFFKDGEIDMVALDGYVKEKVYPFFENTSGGKVLVSNKNGQFESWRNDDRADLTGLTDKIHDALVNSQTSLILEKKSLPGTDGTYAAKYIEVDNSAQKLFVWAAGNVVREINLSGPVYGFQVYGVFPIIDKGLEPIAPGGKRMPYWMAFYRSAKQESWYGLHALIWWYDEAGNKIYEKLSNIGTRQSAGCIRMLLADAKYLYENFEKGDLILIHE